MASNIPITQGMPAHYFKGGGRRPGRGSMAPRRATIGIGGGKKEGGGGDAPSGPASRDLTLGADEQGPPQQETQAPIEATGRNPRFAVGNAANGQIDLGSLLSARTNAAFDPTKAIGGENVPFKPTTGFFGSLRRTFGDDANERNLAAQAQQGAQWRADEATAKALAAEDARWQKRFDTETGFKSAEAEKERSARAAERAADAEAKRISEANRWVQEDERFEQQQIDAIRDRDLKERQFAATQKQNEMLASLQQQGIDLQKQGLNLKAQEAAKPDVRFGPDGTPYIMSGDAVTRIDPFKAPIGKTIPGQAGGPHQIWPDVPKASGGPAAKVGDVQVDPATGRPLGGAPEQAPVTSTRRPSYLMGALENVAGALGLDDISLPTPSLTASPEDIRAAAVKRARYLDPSMQRTY